MNEILFTSFNVKSLTQSLLTNSSSLPTNFIKSNSFIFEILSTSLHIFLQNWSTFNNQCFTIIPKPLNVKKLDKFSNPKFAIQNTILYSRYKNCISECTIRNKKLYSKMYNQKYNVFQIVL